MEFYPPLNLDEVFNKRINEMAAYNYERHYKQKEPSYRYTTFSNRNNQNYNIGFKDTNLYTDDFKNNEKLQKTLRFKDISFTNEPNSTQPKKTSEYVKSLTSVNDLNRIDYSKYLRKLGQNEHMFHGTNEMNRCYIYRSLIITSEIDFYKNLDTIRFAIDEWKSMHPLLRCKVVVKEPYDYPNITASKEKYFVFADKSVVNSQHNVKFLYYKPHSTLTSCDDIWKLVLEKEQAHIKQNENELLWRLTFLKIKERYVGPNMDRLVNMYAVILTYDHCIMDGRSSYDSLLQLFALIEQIYTKTYKKATERKELLPSKEELFINRLKPLEYYLQNRQYLQAPSFINEKDHFSSTYSPLKTLSIQEELNGKIYTHDGKLYSTVNELVEISKNTTSKFRTLTINRADFAKLLKRCKEKNVKLTSFFNVVICLALRMMYEKYDGTHKYENIVYTTNISLRQYDEYKQMPNSLNKSINGFDDIGCYIGLSIETFNEMLSFTKDKDWIEKFWEISKAKCDDLHAKLKKSNFVFPIQLPMKKKEPNEFLYHFGNSNLGSLKNSLTDRKYIKVKQVFAAGRVTKDNFLCWFTNLIASVDDRLCWTVSFNSFVIKQEFIDEYISYLTRIINVLIN